MNQPKRISSHDNPFFKSLLGLATSARARRLAGQTLLDGPHLLRAFLDTGGQPLHLVLNAHAEHNPEISALLAACGQMARTQLDDALFARISGLKTPNGLLALIGIPSVITPPEESRFALLLEDIQDPGNLGSILRSAAAAGCDAVFLSEGCADAWSPKVLRAGMGGHFALSVHTGADLIQLNRAFTGRILAASLQAEHSLYACDLQGRVGFALGNEGAGLSPALQTAAAVRFTIPMPGKAESLNVAAAAAVCLFEAARQRRQAGH